MPGDDRCARAANRLGAGYGLAGFRRRPRRFEQRAPHDAADPVHLDLAADPARHHRRGGGRRGGHRGHCPQARRSRVRDHELAALSAAGGARGDEPFRHHHVHPAAVHRESQHAGLDGPPAHLPADGRDRSRHRLGGDQHRRRGDPQPVHQPRGGGVGVDHRGAEHPSPARPRPRRARTRSRSTSVGCGLRRW